MGVSGISCSHSSYDSPPPKLPNPDPSNFRLQMHATYGEYLVMQINYPDCTNYEGDKILVFKGVTVSDLLEQGSIDPHFSNNPARHSPVARFAPTKLGWLMAKALAVYMTRLEKGL